jgi:hypothetical protein
MTIDELKQKFLQDWDSADLGHSSEIGSHRPDPDSGMAQDLDALIAQALQETGLLRFELGKARLQLDELLEAAKAESVIAYQNRLCLLRHGRIQDYKEFDRLRAVVRVQLAARGEPDPFEGPPLI